MVKQSFQALCVTALVENGFTLVVDSCRLTPDISGLYGESINITKSTAVLALLGETRREADGVMFLVDSNTVQLVFSVFGVLTDTTTSTSEVESVLEHHGVRKKFFCKAISKVKPATQEPIFCREAPDYFLRQKINSCVIVLDKIRQNLLSLTKTVHV